MRRRGIDFSDIPEVSSVQLGAMRRMGRPPWGRRPDASLPFGSIPRCWEPCAGRRSGAGWATSP